MSIANFKKRGLIVFNYTSFNVGIFNTPRAHFSVYQLLAKFLFLVKNKTSAKAKTCRLSASATLSPTVCRFLLVYIFVCSPWLSSVCCLRAKTAGRILLCLHQKQLPGCCPGSGRWRVGLLMTPGGKEILSLKTAPVTFFFYYEKTMSNMGK